MSGLHILPLAFVMIAGPQILTAVFLATSERWQANSALFLTGAALSTTAVTSLAFVVGDDESDGGSDGSGTIFVVVAVLLMAAMIHTFLTRRRAAPPSWMSRLEGATPTMSFVLGLLLFGLFPTDIFTSLGVGTYVAGQGDRWVHVLPFVALTLTLLAIPALAVVGFGERARVWLPRLRDWMNNHSWIVSEVVLGLFVLLSLSNV